jgi:hypothetical protein
VPQEVRRELLKDAIEQVEEEAMLSQPLDDDLEVLPV